MNLAVSVDQKQLLDILLNVCIARPVFIWGAPGIGKSAIVEQFAADMGLPCNRSKLTSATQTLTLRAKELLVELAGISLEIAQMAITPEQERNAGCLYQLRQPEHTGRKSDGV